MRNQNVSRKTLGRGPNRSSLAELAELRERCERLEAIVKLQRLTAQQRSNARLPSLIMNEITRLMNAERGSIFLYDTDTNELRATHADGVELRAIVVPLRMGVIGAAIIQRRTVNIVNAHEHHLFSAATDQTSGYRTDSLLAVPITDQSDRVFGGVQLLNKKEGRFTAQDERYINNLAQRLAEQWGTDGIDPIIAKNEIDQICEEMGCDRGAVFALEKSTGQLKSVYASGVATQIVLPIKLGIAGFVALTGESMLIEDPYSNAHFDSSFDQRTGYRTNNILAVPLVNVSRETLGVVQVMNAQRGAFTPGDLDTLRIIADGLAITIENRNMLGELDQQFHSLMGVMAASLDSRDQLTAGHSTRVAEIAVTIAKCLGFVGDDMDILSVAGLLHDYGKIGIDDVVLRKNGALTDTEYAHIKTHSEMTYSILEKVKFASKYRSVPLIASSHHEAIDGSGYPHGLTENEIPFMAKILAVADVYEALTANRHYRNGMSSEAALAILDRGSGKKFDPCIIGALKESLIGQSEAANGHERAIQSDQG